MEPYRPYVDALVLEYCAQHGVSDELLSNKMKAHMLQINEVAVTIDHNRSPICAAINKTSYSLVECFEGTSNQIIYPIYHATQRI